MRKALLLSAALLLLGAGAWAAPTGPGGSIYWVRVPQCGLSTLDNGLIDPNFYTPALDNNAYLYRVDVDKDWNVVTEHGIVATLPNKFNLDQANYDDASFPEILHTRQTLDGVPTNGDGSVFVATYFDNAAHTRFYRVQRDGTVTVLHPGAGDGSYGVSSNNLEQTPEFRNIIDPWGHAGGKVDAIMGWAGGYGAKTWQDMNSNDDLTDECDTYQYPGYNAGNSQDAEVGARPGGGDTDNQNCHFSMVYSNIKYSVYDGNEADCHTWSPDCVVFHRYSDWSVADGFRCYWQGAQMAVGDPDGDDNVDVYVLTGARSGYNNDQGGIWRLSDLDQSGAIDDNVADMCKAIYDDSTLAGSTNNIGGGDIELVKDPVSGKWSLLVFQAGGSWGACEVDGRILVLELADNGDFVGTADGIKEILAGPGVDNGLETGEITGPNYYYNYSDAWVLLGTEFDPDPIPEPGTLLFLGTGVLGLVGYLRRRRMS